ncbi:sigma-70 family RNA polymerase sigma factor [Paenibacillus sacheonensis]|uniref:Sigma-70 family RNA polymerase sigma factor n=2 Tax=Paenibacillus sacheonensis TaxID=742054 RepID=A0A7X4YQI6_9BACL|nr:sigma-70 family RNA polymerase sigma factor [Paenibacillus sacheonensis]NBC69734.1 sigma-70 family RNA polymerase sigma factor [Paenibacillus sacheonensis]
MEDKLLQLYNSMIVVAMSNVRNQSDAQDAVQEAWVRILTKHRTLRERDKLDAWAKVITANTARTINKQSRMTYPLGDRDPGAEELYCRRDEHRIMMEIRELLESLDSRTRALLLYKFYYGYRDQEIAAAWQVPIGTIKARIHRTKHRLRQWMSY